MTSSIFNVTYCQWRSQVFGGSDNPVVVDYYDPFSPLRIRQRQTLEEVASGFGEVTFLRVNIETYGDLAEACGIHSFPAIAVFYKGKIVGRLVGYKPRIHVQKFLRRTISKAQNPIYVR
jgi:thioredoxin 1